MGFPALLVLAAAGLLSGTAVIMVPGTGAPPAAPAPASPFATSRLPATTAAVPPASLTHRPAARGPSAPVAQWRWPLLVPPRVVRGFDPPAQPWLPGHRGVDLAAVPGDAVVAAGAGVVSFAGPVAGRGVVSVTHGALRTTYEPVTATVRAGDTVAPGDRLGTLAAGSGHCGGVPSCLHWGLLRGTEYLDPLLLLGRSHPVLLPIPSAAG